VQRAEEILNERLAGLTLGEIRTTLRERFADIDPAGGTLVRLILDRADDAFATGRSEDVHIGGTAELLAQPEFSDRQRVQAILEFVEDRTELARVVAQRPGAGVTITFGTELGADEMSLVSAPYSAGQMTGVIGVLGPSRMPYSRMVPLVDKVSRLLTELLSE
jgi:heat-inducible transcriptional repressor